MHLHPAPSLAATPPAAFRPGAGASAPAATPERAAREQPGTAAAEARDAGSVASTDEQHRKVVDAARAERVRARQEAAALQAQVQEMAARDREVRAHERAHLAAAGSLARGMSLTTERGPDGRQYAVAGEVSIDTAAVAGDPQSTIAKAQRIRRAANAPAEPSSQDRRVAAQASAMEMRARVELAAQRAEKIESDDAEPRPDAARGEEVTAAGEAAGHDHGGGACPLCGGADHAGAEHAAGNERRIAAGLQGLTQYPLGDALDLRA